jgi:uncharacterized Zn finger protein
VWIQFKPYVSVAQRHAKAMRKLAQLAKQGHVASPIVARRQIATTFWGKAWCEHLESFSDFASRLPRGRTYVRNGSVVDLKIAPCAVTALVSGSEVYKVRVGVKSLPKTAWNSVKSKCAGRLGSLVELLQGQLSDGVMQIVTDRDHGLFPKPNEIEMECSCPDWAGMCKHIAAVLYGVGARLDDQPELLFELRRVDHRQLVGDLNQVVKMTRTNRRSTRKTIIRENLGDIFGIEMDTSEKGSHEPDTSVRRAGSRIPAPATPVSTRPPRLRTHPAATGKSVMGKQPRSTSRSKTTRHAKGRKRAARARNNRFDAKA